MLFLPLIMKDPPVPSSSVVGSSVLGDPKLEAIQQLRSSAANHPLASEQTIPSALPITTTVPIDRKILLEDDIFHPRIDFSDNEAQAQVIRNHYLNEFGKHSVDLVLNDYSDDSVIHELIDNAPTTYHGKQGVRQMCRDAARFWTKFELEHVAINHNHAQVIWKAETPTHSKVVGTDSFTFDKDNHITSQTIVALSQDDKE